MARNPLTPYRSGGLLGGGGLDDIFSLHRDMNRLFDQVMGGGLAPGGQGAAGSVISARMNVVETDSEVRIEAELPGVTENDVDVSLDDDVLTIRGEKRFERKDEKERHHFVERSYGTFQRAVRLPFPVDPEQVQARFENGVLTVTLPKSAQQDRTRRIQVQSGQSAGSQPPLQMAAQADGQGQQQAAQEPQGQQLAGQDQQGT